MTPEHGADMALLLLREVLAVHALHGDVNAAAMLDDVRKRDRAYRTALVGLLCEPVDAETNT